MKLIRVLLIEDDRLLAIGVARLLSSHRTLSAVAIGTDGGNLWSKVRVLKPHVILLRIPPVIDKFIPIVESLKENIPRVGIIAIGNAPAQRCAMKCIDAGVSGFIGDDLPVSAAVRIIHAVASGKTVIPAPIIGQQFSDIVQHTLRLQDVDEIADAIRITRREQDVIDRIAAGRSNREIAMELNIAVHTVKNHVHHILDKLALENRLQLAIHARKRGLGSGSRDAQPSVSGPPL